MKASELIRGALEDLRHDGWKKGLSFNGEQEACIDTALCRRRGRAWWNSYETNDPYSVALEALDAAAQALFSDRLVGALCSTFVVVNDHKDTTFADVEQVMEKAAVGLEEAGL